MSQTQLSLEETSAVADQDEAVEESVTGTDDPKTETAPISDLEAQGILKKSIPPSVDSSNQSLTTLQEEAKVPPDSPIQALMELPNQSNSTIQVPAEGLEKSDLEASADLKGSVANSITESELSLIKLNAKSESRSVSSTDVPEPTAPRVEPASLPTLAQIRRLRAKMAADSKRVEHMIKVAKNSSHEKHFLSTVEASLREANAKTKQSNSLKPVAKEPRPQETMPAKQMEGGDQNENESKDPVRINCLYEKDLEYYKVAGSGQAISYFYKNLGNDKVVEIMEAEDQQENVSHNNYMEEWKEMRRKEKETKLVEKVVNSKDIEEETPVINVVSNRKKAGMDTDDKSIKEDNKIEKKISKSELDKFKATLKNRISSVQKALAFMTRDKPVSGNRYMEEENFN